jgi:hypothetical protein
MNVGVRVAQARGSNVDGEASTSGRLPTHELVEGQINPMARELEECAFQSLLLNQPLHIAELAAGKVE